MKDIRLFPVVFFVSINFCLLAQNKQDIDSIQVKEIQPIITVGKKHEEGIIPYQKLQGKDLEKVNSLSVAEALQYFSGVQLKDYGGIGGMKTVNIRGMGSQHISVFYDGIQLGNAQNGIVDLGKFSLDNLESISLYNGQKSNIFQPAKSFASSASIYLVSRKPVFKSGKKTNIELSYRSGSFALLNPSIIWEQKISDRVNFLFNFEYLNSDGKYKFRQTEKNKEGSIAWDTTAIRRNGNINAFRVEMGLYGKLHRGSWNLKTYFYDSDRGIPGAIVKNVYDGYAKQWDRIFFTQGSFEKEITSNYKILLNAKYAYDYTHYLNNDPANIYVDNTFRQKEMYISLAQQYSLFPFWKMVLSSDYQYNALESDLSNFLYPERNTELIALASSFHFRKLRFQANILATLVQEQIREKNRGEASPDRQELTPSFFVNYTIFKNLDVHAFYKRIFRMPTFNDLYYTDLVVSDLRPEYTTQYDVGLSYIKDFQRGRFTHFSFVADGYYNEVKDMIIAFPRGQQFRWLMLNLGKVRIQGVELNAETSLLLTRGLLFTMKANYTYEKAQNITSKQDSYYKDQIPYIPQHSGSMLLGLDYKGWDLNYSFIYTGERYDGVENIERNYEAAWYTHDLSLSKEIRIKAMIIRAGVEVNNLLDKQYEVIQNYPMPGRNYRISLRIKI